MYKILIIRLLPSAHVQYRAASSLINNTSLDEKCTSAINFFQNEFDGNAQDCVKSPKNFPRHDARNHFVRKYHRCHMLLRLRKDEKIPMRILKTTFQEARVY